MLDDGISSLVTDIIADSITRNAENAFVLQRLKKEVLSSDLSIGDKLEEITKIDKELRKLRNAELKSTINNVKKSLV